MTKDEALKLALKALDIYDYTGTAEESELVSKAINACKEALEQSVDWNNRTTHYCKAEKQPDTNLIYNQPTT